ncbi:ribosome recycling factor [Spiroplasma endosymbiont of Othius punctulatus]|uniref:ribosome recycling factor n=1 Tax=Spiroplasma endosymbiont of Othius punctulatus TaxID=3066289 RepID=UPI0030D59374
MNMQEIIEIKKLEMSNVIELFEDHITKFRTGRASAIILNSVVVDYYGTPTPIKHLASIVSPESHQLVVTPYDRSLVALAAAAISKSNLGVTVSNEGTLIRIKIPALTTETRQQIVKELKKDTENYRVKIRNLRRDANTEIKAEKQNEDWERDGMEIIDKITKEFIELLDKTSTEKETEILTI